jgi:hypothetical protein
MVRHVRINSMSAAECLGALKEAEEDQGLPIERYRTIQPSVEFYSNFR